MQGGICLPPRRPAGEENMKKPKAWPPTIPAPHFTAKLIAEQASFCRKYLAIHGFLSEQESVNVQRRIQKTLPEYVPLRKLRASKAQEPRT